MVEYMYLSVGVVTSGKEERDYMSIITPALLAVVAQEGSKVVFVFTKLAFYCVHGTACNIEVGP